MPLPHRRRTLRATLPVLLIGLLATACSGNRPQISAQQEAGTYKARAHRNYTPPGPASDPWGPYITEASGKFDVPERWIREVMRQESGGRLYGRNGDLVTSGAGAMGLMQVMPGTYDELRARYSELGDDPYDPRNNILAGTAYVREMYDIYGSPGFLAAYNAGPGRLDDYLTRNRGLPEETRRYVANIGPRIAGAEPNRASPGAQYAMNNLPTAVGSGPRYAPSSRYSAPPIALAAATPAPVITLNPVQTAAYVPPPVAPPAPVVQMAQLPEPPHAPVQALAQGPYIVLQPQEPEQQFAQIPEPPAYQQRPQPAISAPIAIAMAPAPAVSFVPPLPVAPPPRSQVQMAAAGLVQVAPRGFALVSPANAEPLGLRRGGASTGGWAVQVGAFANEGLAASANTAARDHARDLLASARTTVTPVRQPGGTLFRARLTGLSRDAAAQACERLARARTTCMMVSPDAQS